MVGRQLLVTEQNVPHAHSGPFMVSGEYTRREKANQNESGQKARSWKNHVIFDRMAKRAREANQYQYRSITTTTPELPQGRGSGSRASVRVIDERGAAVEPVIVEPREARVAAGSGDEVGQVLQRAVEVVRFERRELDVLAHVGRDR